MKVPHSLIILGIGRNSALLSSIHAAKIALEKHPLCLNIYNKPASMKFEITNESKGILNDAFGAVVELPEYAKKGYRKPTALSRLEQRNEALKCQRL